MCIALSTPLTRDSHTRQSDKTHRLEDHKGGASEQLALRHPFVAAATAMLFTHVLPEHIAFNFRH